MQQSIESPYSASTTAEEALGATDLSGKLVVITGGSAGIGKETARVLANAGIMATPLQRNSLGIESQLATNYVGHALLTSLLAVHPGYIQTELGRYMGENEWETTMDATAKMSGKEAASVKTVSQGAATSVWAATSTALKGKGPLYLEDCGVAKIIDKPNMMNGVLAHAIDEDMAGKLWSKAEELLGRSLPL